MHLLPILSPHSVLTEGARIISESGLTRFPEHWYPLIYFATVTLDLEVVHSSSFPRGWDLYNDPRGRFPVTLPSLPPALLSSLSASETHLPCQGSYRGSPLPSFRMPLPMWEPSTSLLWRLCSHALLCGNLSGLRKSSIHGTLSPSSHPKAVTCQAYLPHLKNAHWGQIQTSL